MTLLYIVDQNFQNLNCKMKKKFAKISQKNVCSLLLISDFPSKPFFSMKFPKGYVPSTLKFLGISQKSLFTPGGFLRVIFRKVHSILLCLFGKGFKTKKKPFRANKPTRSFQLFNPFFDVSCRVTSKYFLEHSRFCFDVSFL